MSRRRIHGGTGFAAVLITLGLLVPAGATAAPAKPGVTTGPAANVGQSTATLTGRVNPNEVETTYTFEDAPGGGTRVGLRNSGEPSGFAKVLSSVMKSAMRRENTKDLARLKELLEDSRPTV